MVVKLVTLSNLDNLAGYCRSASEKKMRVLDLPQQDSNTRSLMIVSTPSSFLKDLKLDRGNHLFKAAKLGLN